ncbi:hypothetical protein B1H19_37355 [Streptomyces gilvosporeus]|uniref:Lipoprotein n=2 Tax=Streptomyces gilvosporeus TaxID=553510 RepID=A0A1V0U247_9ACTN|nr:hypothetical protein B1H19_37355 [Streptomyces gilvosporeus]
MSGRRQGGVTVVLALVALCGCTVVGPHPADGRAAPSPASQRADASAPQGPELPERPVRERLVTTPDREDAKAAKPHKMPEAPKPPKTSEASASSEPWAAPTTPKGAAVGAPPPPRVIRRTDPAVERAHPRQPAPPHHRRTRRHPTVVRVAPRWQQGWPSGSPVTAQGMVPVCRAAAGRVRPDIVRLCQQLAR